MISLSNNHFQYLWDTLGYAKREKVDLYMKPESRGKYTFGHGKSSTNRTLKFCDMLQGFQQDCYGEFRASFV